MADKNRDFDTTEIILDSIADGVFTVDADWKITSFNKAAEIITGISREEATGQRCCDVFRASICETGCAIRETIETNRAIVNKPIFIINARGEKIPISISAAILKDKRGRTIGGVETFRDLSAYEELRQELNKKYSSLNEKLQVSIGQYHQSKTAYEELLSAYASDELYDWFFSHTRKGI